MTEISLSKKNRYHILLCICVLIFVAALLFRLMKLILDPALMRDSALYLQWVEKWYETGDYYFERFGVQVKTAILPIWLMKEAMLSGFGAEIAGRALSLFLGSLIPVAGFYVALYVTKKIRLALVSAILLILHPDLVTYSIQPLRDNFYILFEAFLLLSIVVAIKKDSHISWGICGLFTALISFCRYEGLEFLVIVSFVIMATTFFKKSKWKNMFLKIAVFSVFFGITSLFLLSLSDYDLGVISKIVEMQKVKNKKI